MRVYSTCLICEELISGCLRDNLCGYMYVFVKGITSELGNVLEVMDSKVCCCHNFFFL
jgi:hypothetical protein